MKYSIHTGFTCHRSAIQIMRYFSRVIKNWYYVSRFNIDHDEYLLQWPACGGSKWVCKWMGAYSEPYVTSVQILFNSSVAGIDVRTSHESADSAAQSRLALSLTHANGLVLWLEDLNHSVAISRWLWSCWAKPSMAGCLKYVLVMHSHGQTSTVTALTNNHSYGTSQWLSSFAIQLHLFKLLLSPQILLHLKKYWIAHSWFRDMSDGEEDADLARCVLTLLQAYLRLNICTERLPWAWRISIGLLNPLQAPPRSTQSLRRTIHAFKLILGALLLRPRRRIRFGVRRVRIQRHLYHPPLNPNREQHLLASWTPLRQNLLHHLRHILRHLFFLSVPNSSKRVSHDWSVSERNRDRPKIPNGHWKDQRRKPPQNASHLKERKSRSRARETGLSMVASVRLQTGMYIPGRMGKMEILCGASQKLLAMWVIEFWELSPFVTVGLWSRNHSSNSPSCRHTRSTSRGCTDSSILELQLF